LWSRNVASEKTNSGKLLRGLSAVDRNRLKISMKPLVQSFPRGVGLKVGAFSFSFKDLAMRILLA